MDRPRMRRPKSLSFFSETHFMKEQLLERERSLILERQRDSLDWRQIRPSSKWTLLHWDVQFYPSALLVMEIVEISVKLYLIWELQKGTDIHLDQKEQLPTPPVRISSLFAYENNQLNLKPLDVNNIYFPWEMTADWTMRKLQNNMMFHETESKWNLNS